MTGNTFINNALAHLAKNASPRVVSAIRDASTRTGVDFSYLLEQAAAESSFDVKAEATTSSASGLFQFIERTWLRMVKNHGDKHGLQEYTQHIDENFDVQDDAMRDEILDLRFDPQVASFMAAEFAAENKSFLQKQLGNERDLEATDLYLAHFLGASGASGFLKAMDENPLETAAHVMPKAAAANYNVFYDSKTGEARSLAGVYEFFEKKFAASNQQSEMSPAADVIEHVAAAPSAPRAQVPYSSLGADRQAEVLAQVMQNRQDAMINVLTGMAGHNDSSYGRASVGGRNNALAALSTLSHASLLQSPVELMLMAQLDDYDTRSDKKASIN